MILGQMITLSCHMFLQKKPFPGPDDNIVLPHVFSKEVFQAIVTIQNYLLQYDCSTMVTFQKLCTHYIKLRIRSILVEKKNNQLWKYIYRRYDLYLLICMKFFYWNICIHVLIYKYIIPNIVIIYLYLNRAYKDLVFYFC